MTSANSKKNTNKPAFKLPDPTALKNRALLGLFQGLGLENDWTQRQEAPREDPSDALVGAARALLVAADKIVTEIRGSSAANNQFALYNLAYPRILLEELKRMGTAEAKVKIVDKKEEQAPLNRIALAVAEIREELSSIADPDGSREDGVGKNVSSGVTKYFNRQNFTMTQCENYGFILFLHIGISKSEGFSLTDEKVLRASPSIFGMVRDAAGILSDNCGTPDQLAEEVTEALTTRRDQRNAISYLGGLMELGKTDIRDLWSPLFGKLKKDHDILSRNVSEERHYVCYRLTSSLVNVRVLKSFLVLQAPGRVKHKPDSRRDHFAVKAFTKYDGGMTRSVGAIVPLGKEVVCFASRRDKAEEQESGGWQPPINFRGATMLIFSEQWFQGKSGILSGMLMTTNQDTRTASCPIVCVPSCAPHSDDVELGQIEFNQLVEDMCRYTRLTGARDANSGDLERYILEKLLQSHGLETQEVDPSWPGGPPVVAHNIKPADLRTSFQRFGYEVRDPKELNRAGFAGGSNS
ncbi:hypothetical protein MWU60_08645 [Yoonia sp. F2084L]|uniref:hypothetical protein n=1 Tax=Yoonia sp. F2084L TaxID=2926419 RepID=UPI001FF5C12E|nr:hypothetical protein [Yoonia sp. F2084L]MCK0095636.1 hypothetical protein [Yoonia sp. F2084L]